MGNIVSYKILLGHDRHKSPVKVQVLKCPTLAPNFKFQRLKCPTPGLRSNYPGWDLHRLSNLPGLLAPFSTRAKTLKSISNSYYTLV